MKSDLRIRRPCPLPDLGGSLCPPEFDQDLSLLTPVVKKIATSSQLTEIVAKLRRQLEAAHRTIAELRT